MSGVDAAVARADFIAIHCPKTPETVGMFDAAWRAHERTVFIVNTARGGIIDQGAQRRAEGEPWPHFPKTI